MLAATFSEFGGPDVLRLSELPDPAPRAGEVMVRVVAATVNPTDTMMRAGRQAALMTSLKPPYICGQEFAGFIHRVADGVSPFAVGERVIGIVNARRQAGGAYAQYVCVPASSVARLPAGIDLVEAATVPMNGLTAKLCIDAVDMPRGSTVLVTGGAGALGGYVIQLGRNAGFTILADGKDADADLLRRLGAHDVVPRGEQMEAALRRRHPDGVDALVDCALLTDRAAALVRNGGRAVMLRRSNPISDPRLNVRYVNVFDAADGTAALAQLVQHVSTGVLTPRVATRLPISQAAEGHRLVERGGLRGRVVLTF